MNEEKILKMMKALEISREEAIQLMEDDKEVDRMTKMSDINGDLSDVQKKAQKQARQVGRKVATQKPKREKKINNEKIEIVNTLIEALGDVEVNVLNPEREFEFFKDGKKYKIVLSMPRK